MIDPAVAATRIALALLFGAAIGVEREWRHKTAGIKTNTFVTLGSAVFAMMSDTFGVGNHNPAQLAAAVVSGIGFIGAGVIIHRGASVQGVTTAATLWANASMGIALGLGYYAIGALTFGGMLVIQFGLRSAVSAVARRGSPLGEIDVHVECTEPALPEVNRLWREFALQHDVSALGNTIARSGAAVSWRVSFRASRAAALDLPAFEERAVMVTGVRRIDAQNREQPAEP